MYIKTFALVEKTILDNYDPMCGHFCLAVADLMDDGRPHLVVTYNSDSGHIFRNHISHLANKKNIVITRLSDIHQPRGIHFSSLTLFDFTLRDILIDKNDWLFEIATSYGRRRNLPVHVLLSHAIYADKDLLTFGGKELGRMAQMVVQKMKSLED